MASYIMQWKDNSASRRHRQGRLFGFFAWAVRMHYAVDNPVESAVARPRVDPAPRIILTPEQTRKLLRRAKESDVIGSWVLTLFAGMRTAEVLRFGQLENPWSSIHLGSRIIEIPECVAKTGPRSIPMQPVLESWLRWLKSQQGGFAPTCYWLKRQSILHEILARPVSEGKGEINQANIGRRSYISYLLALPGASYGEIANQVGNQEGILRRHYARKVTRADALAYFDLFPEKL